MWRGRRIGAKVPPSTGPHVREEAGSGPVRGGEPTPNPVATRADGPNRTTPRRRPCRGGIHRKACRRARPREPLSRSLRRIRSHGPGSSAATKPKRSRTRMLPSEWSTRPSSPLGEGAGRGANAPRRERCCLPTTSVLPLAGRYIGRTVESPRTNVSEPSPGRGTPKGTRRHASAGRRAQAAQRSPSL
jgi:hypothetical protein